MPEHVITVEIKRAWLCRSDGLLFGVRLTSPNHPGLVDMLLWLNRETDDPEELRPYRLGMLRRRPR